ncbi:MAG TPA: hypothetical protein GXX63_12355 [Tissierellia bacterium]|nr:hypothetical protein [Tissierellia bacterium]
MYKYNLKSFFEDRVIQNDEWVSNGHFLFKKSILPKRQQQMLEKFSQNKDKLNQILKIAEDAKESFMNSGEQSEEFLPELVFEYMLNGIKRDGLYNSKLQIAFNLEYYNMFMKNKCKIYKGNGSYNPAIILKNNEFVGILMPVRTTPEGLKNAITYEDYITQIKQDQAAKTELKKLNKKCLYINNNKAIVRNKPLKCVAEITGDNKYKNLYVDVEADKNGYVDVYVDLDVVCMYTGRTAKQNNIIDDAEYYFNNLNSITLETYKTYINNALDNNKWINTAEIKLMELAGEPKEYIDKLIQHRKNIKKLREIERMEEEKRRQQEENQFINEKNKIAYDNIAQAEEGIINNETIDNINITIYNSKYDSNTTSLILYLMKKYNIKVPIKTQGWINNALANIRRDEYSNGYTYQYYTSSSDSTVFYKYLNELVNKIKEEYKKIA